MSWYPSGLEQPIRRLADAIDQRFQQIHPNGPVELPAYSASDLAKLVPTTYCTAINSTTAKPVFAVQSGGVFVWRYADGTAI